MEMCPCHANKLDDPILPWYRACFRVDPVLQQVPLHLPFHGDSVGTSHLDGVLQVATLSPCSSHKVTVCILCLVQLLVLKCWVPGPHQVVEEHTGCDDELHSGGVSITWNLLARMPKAFSTTLLARERR